MPRNIFHAILLVFISLYASGLHAQKRDSLKAKHVFYPLTVNHSSLAHQLTNHVSSDSAKVIIIYDWITRHIDYDYKNYLSDNLKRQKANTILLRRKGVCQHMAELFQTMCRDVGIQSILIPGYTRETDFYEGITPFWCNHIWNAVLVNGHWYLVEPTYGNGEVTEYTIHLNRFLYRFLHITHYRVKTRKKPQNYRYCFYPSDSLILTGLPIIPEYQLLMPSVDLKTWTDGQEATKNSISLLRNPSIQNLQYTNYESNYDYYLLALGLKNVDFNKNNHREIAYPAIRISYDMYRSYKKRIRKSDNINYKLSYLDTLSHYVELAAKASTHFKTEAYKYHSNVIKHSKIRYRALYKTNRGRYGYFKSRYRTISRKRSYFARRAGRSENSITYLIKKHHRRTTDDIYRTRKKGKLDSLKSIRKFKHCKNLIDSLSRSISKNEHQLDLLLDSISQGKKILLSYDNTLDSLYQIQLASLDTLYQLNAQQKANEVVFDQNELIARIYVTIKQEHKKRDLVYQKQIYPYIREIRSLVNKTIPKHARIKREIKSLKSNSSISFKEDSMYRAQNQQYTITLDYLEESIKRLIDVARHNARLYQGEQKACRLAMFETLYNAGLEQGRHRYIVGTQSRLRRQNRARAMSIHAHSKKLKNNIIESRIKLKEEQLKEEKELITKN